MSVIFQWRGNFRNDEINELHGAAFVTRVYSEAEWNWVDLTARHSLGWVVARDDERLVGFVNVVWDGLVHAWIQDMMVDPRDHRRGIGRQLAGEAANAARAAGCEWLHVDFDDDLRSFYFDACGFTPTNAGLIALQ
jgi:GNAT superfamily N-acetyltransferase